jgi:molecular chaperone DnaK
VRSKLVVKAAGAIDQGCEFQVDSLETGWSSGRQPLKDGVSVELTLAKLGENHFKVFVFDSSGSPIGLENDRVSIARTAASVDSIPASHSLGVEALEKAGGRSVMKWLVRAGDPLPKKGVLKFYAGESVRAGSQNSLQFKLWEGDISTPVSDNRPIGALKVTGRDLEQGVIAQGAELVCEYEVSDSGNVTLEVSVPSVGGTFHSGHNFYSRQEGQIDYSNAGKRVIEEGEQQLTRLDEMAEKLDDPQIERAREKLDQALSLNTNEGDPERAKEAMDRVLEAKRLIAKIREANLKTIRRMELDSTVAYFNEHIRSHAKPSEETQYDNAVRNANRAIDVNDPSFEQYLDELRGKNWDILWKQDAFVIARFNWLSKSPHLFVDQAEFGQLTAIGSKAVKDDDMQKLRDVLSMLEGRRIRTGGSDMTEGTNIVVA